MRFSSRIAIINSVFARSASDCLLAASASTLATRSNSMLTWSLIRSAHSIWLTVPTSSIMRGFSQKRGVERGLSRQSYVETSGGRQKRALRLFLAQQLAGNHQPLNFAGAFANRAELYITIELFGG